MLITELLLDAMADPDVRAAEDDSFLDRTLVMYDLVKFQQIGLGKQEAV